jgi:hypothetical protein
MAKQTQAEKEAAKVEKAKQAERAQKRVAKAKKMAIEAKREMPEFKDDEGMLKTLKRKDFPDTKDGKVVFCDYQIARWEERKLREQRAADPLTRKRDKLAKMKQKLAELEAELMAEATESAE